jgi:uncharacterized metal-binding protein
MDVFSGVTQLPKRKFQCSLFLFPLIRLFSFVCVFSYFIFIFSVSVLSFISVLFRVTPELTKRAFNYISQIVSSVFYYLLEVVPANILATWTHAVSLFVRSASDSKFYECLPVNTQRNR